MPSTRKRRTRTKSPTTSEVVAPGGGTQNDVDKLAKNLGLPNAAVSAILNCEGNGLPKPSSRNRRSSGGANSMSDANPVVSSAWADFMSEEGFGGGKSGEASTNDNNTVKVTDGDGTDGSNKRLKSANDDDKEDFKSKQATVEDSGPREYELPIRTYKPPAGILAQTGTLDSVIVGRSKRALNNVEDLQEPTLLTYETIFEKQKFSFIAASSSSAHSIAITTDGVAYAWGRNEAGQCGTGYTSSCVPLPTRIDLSGNFVAAAVGKSHSILLDEDGNAYAVGSNKCGQCGVNTKIEAILNWKKCVFEKGTDGDAIEIVQASCGEQFTVLLTSEGHIYSAGLSEFGQLGNGETGEYFITASKLAFANATKFERRATFVHSLADSGQSNLEGDKKTTLPLSDAADIKIGHISCGKNHTIAIEAPCKNKTHAARVFSWGCGGYGVLGHHVQADEYFPRLIATLQGPLFKSNSPVRAAAGANCSMVLTENGHVYYCGKHKSAGEATMRPSLIDVLANNNHVVKAVSGGYQSVFCATANGVTVSWGMGQTGELGFGATNAKSSSKPKFVEKLDKCLVTDVACGYGHTLFLIRDEDEEDAAALKKVARIEAKDLSSFITRATK